MGGADAVLARARSAYVDGDYRWVAEVVNHVVFADPDNQAARRLQADALEQLGYQAESGVWRNFYLTAAQELRSGVAAGAIASLDRIDALRAMSPELFWDSLAMRLNGVKAGARRITINVTFPDLDESYCLMVRNGALSHRSGRDEGADVSFTIDRRDFEKVLVGKASVPELIAGGSARLDGNATALQEFVGLLDSFELWFNIVTP